MIINLNLQEKRVLIIGGGKEAEKRIRCLLKEKCQIIVISSKASKKITKWASAKKLKLEIKHLRNTNTISKYKPHVIITTTNNSELNHKILNFAKKRKILAYSSDDSESSDFSNPAIIDIEKIVQIAIFTGGKSPAMSKKIKDEAQRIFKKVITKEDIAQIKIQQIARKEAKKTIPVQNERRLVLSRIINDKIIKQLIKDGQLKDAERRAISLVRGK